MISPLLQDNHTRKHNRLAANTNFSLYLALILAVFFGGILLAKLTGHWHSHITYEEYRLLIPQVSNLGQP